MNLTQLKCFLLSASTLNFTKTAQLMFMTQPVVSRQIQSLEMELNVELFVREHKRIRLTEAGELFYNRLSVIVGDLNTLIQEVQTIGQGYIYSLKIGNVSGHSLDDRLAGAASQLVGRRENLQINIVPYEMNEILNALYREEVDVIVTVAADILGLDDVQSIPLGEDKICLCYCASHVAKSNAPFALSQFKDFTFLIFRESISNFMLGSIQNMCRETNFEPKYQYVSSVSEMNNWLTAGKYVSCVSERNLASQLPNMRTIYPFSNTFHNPELALVYLKKNTNPILEEFLKLITRQTGK